MGVELTTHEVLALWRETLVEGLKEEEPDLTSRQMAILLTVYLEPPPHTVRGLAEDLNISKAAVTRALDILGRLNLLRRKRDDEDRRNVLVQRTVKGSVFLSDFAERVVTTGRRI